MFHIKADRRAQKSAELIVQAMDECLKDKSFNDLSISAVCQRSTVSRATFYRLFDTLEDVVAYQCDIFADNFEKKIPGLAPGEIIVSFLNSWMENLNLLELIVEIHREDILLDCHMRKRESLENIWLQNTLHLTDYHIALLSGSLITILVTWVKEGKKESPQQLKKLFSRVLNDLAHAIS